MKVTALRCVSCGDTYPADEVRYECDCGGSVDVEYEYSGLDGLTWDRLHKSAYSHERYRPFLPDVDPKHRTSMGAGGTRTIASRTLGPEMGLDNLVFKLESLNPTGSFKDRGTAVELGVAQDHGADEVVVASTGNMGASIAAYTARAGVTATIFVPATTGGPKLAQMRAHGADIVTVDGDYNLAAQKAWNEYEEHGAYLMGDYPYRGEGEKTIGHEIGDHAQHADGVDTVVTPVGNGTLIHGTYKGLRELQTVGLTGSTPRMVGVQAAGCNTVVDALQKGYDAPRAVEQVDTVAGAIACGDPLDGDQAMAAITDSDGFGAAVSDEQILHAQRDLARKEGIYAEEAAAAAFAGIRDNVDRFAADERIVCVICGHGLKTGRGGQ